MSAERLLASYIVRVLVRSGERSISLHDLRSGESRTFGSYAELLEHLSRDRQNETITLKAAPDPEEGPE